LCDAVRAIALHADHLAIGSAERMIQVTSHLPVTLPEVPHSPGSWLRASGLPRPASFLMDGT
jgi:hypothetical protein